MREWLVIESSRKHALFVPNEERERKGYIPRDVVEGLLGRKLLDDRPEWFTAEEGRLMRAHPEWRDTPPPTKRRAAKADGR